MFGIDDCGQGTAEIGVRSRLRNCRGFLIAIDQIEQPAQQDRIGLRDRSLDFRIRGIQQILSDHRVTFHLVYF